MLCIEFIRLGLAFVLSFLLHQLIFHLDVVVVTSLGVGP